MSAIITRNQPGRMAKQIVAAFSQQQLAGLGREPTGTLQNVIGRGFDFLSDRFGTPSGTIRVNADGSMIQRQAEGFPIHTQAPIAFGAGLQAPSGFATALGGTTGLLIIGGIVVLAMFAGKRR